MISERTPLDKKGANRGRSHRVLLGVCGVSKYRLDQFRSQYASLLVGAVVRIARRWFVGDQLVALPSLSLKCLVASLAGEVGAKVFVRGQMCHTVLVSDVQVRVVDLAAIANLVENMTAGENEQTQPAVLVAEKFCCCR